MLQLVWSRFDRWPAGWREQSAACLSAAEEKRLTRLRSRARGDQFLAGRLLVRQLVSERTGADPQAILLAASAPTLASGDSGTTLCHISISHSGNFLAAAVASHPVGIDCEQVVARRNWQEIATAYFSDSEARWLRQLPPQVAAREFVRLWTAKEALSKCTGMELVQVLAQMEMPQGRLRSLPRMQRFSCWSGSLSDSLFLSVAAQMEPGLAPQQLGCQFREQPDHKSSSDVSLLLLPAQNP